MADQKISELTALTGANLADVDAFAVVDTSAVQTKKITYAELKTALDTGTGFVRITGDTMTGALVAPTINVSGNIDVDGTSNLDVVDIDGALTQDGGAVFNEGSADVDFRVESDDDANAFFVEGSTGNVGLGTNSPTGFSGYTTIQTDDATGGLFDIAIGGTRTFNFQASASAGAIQTRTAIPILFDINSSEKMRLDTSGRLLLGTTTAGEASGDDLTIATTGHTGITLRSGTSSDGHIYFSDGTSGADQYRGYLQYNHQQNRLAFGTNASERLRIDASGDVGIGTSTMTAKLNVIDTSDADKQIVFGNNTTYFGSIGHNAGTGANIYTTENNGHHKFLMASTEHVRIDLNGNLLVGRTDNPSGVTDGIYVTGAYAQTASSSANMFINSEGRMMRSTSSLRYKNTINDATHGLTEVLALRPVTFKGNNDGDTIFGGLIAEEVHDAGLTEFVQYNNDNQPDALNYGNMVSLCIKAIQELKAENTALANRITTLEGA